MTWLWDIDVRLVFRVLMKKFVIIYSRKESDCQFESDQIKLVHDWCVWHTLTH